MVDEITCRFSSDRVCNITEKLCIHEDPEVCEHFHTAYELGCKRSPVDLPPVDIDDTVYFIVNNNVYKATVCLISWTKYRGSIVTEIRGEVTSFHTVSARWEEWNVTVFRTEKEAYAKLNRN